MMDVNPSYIPPLPQSQPPIMPTMQPLPFGRVIAMTQTIYRQRFATYFLPALLVIAPISIATSVLSGSLIDQSQALTAESKLLQQSSRAATSLSQAQLQAITADSLKVLSAALVVVLVAFAVQLIRLVIVDSVLVYLTSEHILGRRMTFSQALSAVRARWGAVVLGQCALYTLLIGLSVALAFTLFLCGLGFGLLVYLGLALGALLTPVLILEQVGVPQGLGRAWGLGKGRLWALIAMVAVTVLLGVAVAIPIGIVNGAIAGLFSTSAKLTGSGIDSLPVLVISGLLTGLSSALITPIGLIGYTVLYYDARIRLEGFGESLAALKDPEARPNDILPPTGLNLSAMKGGDFINLALVTAGTFVFILVYAAIAFSVSAAGGIK